MKPTTTPLIALILSTLLSQSVNAHQHKHPIDDILQIEIPSDNTPKQHSRHHKHHRHEDNKTHGQASDQSINHLLKRNGQCQFPTDAGLVPITPGEQNAGWAMSPDQPCQANGWCPYACPPGQLSAQWDPSVTTYSYPGSQYGGLFCDQDGNLQKPFPDKPYCYDGTGALSLSNKCSGEIALCQTVLPGNEAMLIPTSITAGSSEVIAVPDPSYWASTAAHYYLNPPGISTSEGCVWGSNANPYGNWSPYVAGANTDGNGNTFAKIGWNPIYLDGSGSFCKTMPNFGVRIVCEEGSNCNGLPCSIDPSANSLNTVTSGQSTNGAGGASFCVVTAENHGKAIIEVFEVGSASSRSSPESSSSSSSSAFSFSSSPSSPSFSSSSLSSSSSQISAPSSSEEQTPSTSSTPLPPSPTSSYSTPSSSVPPLTSLTSTISISSSLSSTPIPTSSIEPRQVLNLNAQVSQSTTTLSSQNELYGVSFVSNLALSRTALYNLAHANNTVLTHFQNSSTSASTVTTLASTISTTSTSADTSLLFSTTSSTASSSSNSASSTYAINISLIMVLATIVGLLLY